MSLGCPLEFFNFRVFLESFWQNVMATSFRCNSESTDFLPASDPCCSLVRREGGGWPASGGEGRVCNRGRQQCWDGGCAL